jgi:tRNA(Ile)-lysidine synthase
MPARAPFANGTIARPMLRLSRSAIERYAEQHALRWVEDPSNAETRFARNYLRAKVMPRIREQWAGAIEAIARSAEHMAAARELLHDAARADLAKCIDGEGLRVTGLRALPRERRHNALRVWIAAAGLETPSTAQAIEIGGRVLMARPDSNPQFEWNGSIIRRRGGRLLLEVRSADRVEVAAELISKSWRWKRDRECILNRAGDKLVLEDDPAGPLDLDALPETLEIRARAGGETLRPGRRARTQALKKLIQAAKLPKEVRARMPLLWSGKRLLTAGDRWADASVMANDKSRRRARLRWTRK